MSKVCVVDGNLTFATLLKAVGLLWVGFAVFAYFADYEVTFHALDGAAVAIGLVAMSAYAPVLVDAWRNRRGVVDAGHLLALGVVTNWLGFVIRFARWYITEAVPVTGECGPKPCFPYWAWAYSVGLMISITAGLLLIGATALINPHWSPKRLTGHIVAFTVLTVLLWVSDYFYPHVFHFGYSQ
jgi:hypothetical protein